ncbi:hypothetical protein N665_0437s0018 [Sinapis alba]|nr:hypothetical protein N665_0437s0018 [Sinapis alba]
MVSSTVVLFLVLIGVCQIFFPYPVLSCQFGGACCVVKLLVGSIYLWGASWWWLQLRVELGVYIKHF